MLLKRKNLKISKGKYISPCIVSIFLIQFVFATDSPGKNIDIETQIVKKLNQVLEDLTKENEFSGVVLFARNGHILFYEAYGLANRSYNIPNKLDTKFNLASMGKIFTAVAIAQLVEQGKISFDDPIGKFCDKYLIREEVGNKVLIRHLLSHTSGLGNYLTDDYMKTSKHRIRSLDDHKPFISDKLAFKPGTKWQYSNTGTLLLGFVIENITKKSYYDYINDHIFKPAQMKNSGFYEMDIPVPNIAIGYYKDKNGVIRNNIHLVGRGSPAGGVYSTAEDLLKFYTALRTNTLLKEETRDKLWTVQPNTDHYGFGFQVFNDPPSVGHTGGFWGVSAVIDIYLESKYTLIVLTNYGYFRPVRMAVYKLIKEDN